MCEHTFWMYFPSHLRSELLSSTVSSADCNWVKFKGISALSGMDLTKSVRSTEGLIFNAMANEL